MLCKMAGRSAGRPITGLGICGFFLTTEPHRVHSSVTQEMLIRTELEFQNGDRAGAEGFQDETEIESVVRGGSFPAGVRERHSW